MAIRASRYVEGLTISISAGPVRDYRKPDSDSNLPQT